MVNRANLKYLLVLHVELLVFSLGGVCSKMAAQNEFLSFWWLFWYALVILNLGVYAIVWQQIIKHLPLSTAYANKAITIVVLFDSADDSDVIPVLKEK